MRLAILGGTFDPVHNAHLAMARAALEALAPERVVFMPTGKAAYRNAAVASAQDRLAMLKLAVAGEPRFAVDERELAPEASGYTVDTLRALRAERPEAELYFLMGADQLEKFPSWRAPEEIRRLARLAVFARPGHAVRDESVRVVPMTPLDVSASEIRARVARGESVAGLVPAPVANYIERKGIYR